MDEKQIADRLAAVSLSGIIAEVKALIAELGPAVLPLLPAILAAAGLAAPQIAVIMAIANVLIGSQHPVAAICGSVGHEVGAVDPTLLAQIDADLTALQAAQTADTTSDAALAADATALATINAQTATDTTTKATTLAAFNAAAAKLLADVQAIQPGA